MKLSIAAATALALFSSYASAWNIELFDGAVLYGKSISFQRAAAKTPQSTCVDFKYKDGEKEKSFGVKSLVFLWDEEKGDKSECGLWAHRKEKCGSRGDAKLMLRGVQGHSTKFNYKRRGWGDDKPKSIQIDCGGPRAKIARNAKLHRFKLPKLRKNCAKPSKCDRNWATWMMMGNCTDYCAEKALTFNYTTGKGCTDGFFEKGRRKCCCLPVAVSLKIHAPGAAIFE
jgi:hypothetical protein